jgi:hypothetical protein
MYEVSVGLTYSSYMDSTYDDRDDEGVPETGILEVLGSVID